MTAYGNNGGRGRGGGRPPPYQPWANPPPGVMNMSPQALMGPPVMMMLDRGGPPPPHFFDGRGNMMGGGRGRGGPPHHGNRGFAGGYQQDVVEIHSSDDDNNVEDAVRDGGRKRNRSGSNSHKRKKHKRSRSRSRSPKHSHHHSREHDNRQDERHRRRDDRNSGGDRDHHRHHSDNRNQYQRQGGRWDQQDGDRRNDRDRGRHSGGGGGGGGRGHWGSNEPPPPGTSPWSLDTNPFDQFQQSLGNFGGDGRHGYGRGRGFGGPPPPGFGFNDMPPRNFHPGSYHQQNANMEEMRRVQISQNFPKKVFLEEVNLQSEFAFRLDSSPNPEQVNHRSMGMRQKSAYDGGVGKGIFGASEDEISKVYSKFHAFRCKLPDNVKNSEDEDDSQDSGDETLKRSRKEGKDKDSVAKNYISLDKDDGHRNREGRSRGRDRDRDRDRFDTGRDFDSYSFEPKAGEMSIKEKVEYYNKEVRNQPQNIQLWKEFVQFQDKVAEEANQIFEQESESPNFTSGRAGKKKNRSNRKQLLEKKISILDKALKSNTKSLPLNMMRLELLLELEKPRNVLTEWKKLVTQHQQLAPFWIEYLLFSSSQLMIYSNSTILNVFETCFQKYRLMMNPKYPEFQRPPKFPLFISDIAFGLSLLLRNAGFMEKAVALHQAQLEFDFYCPKDLFKDNTLVDWKDEAGIFEEFWDSETQRFGEVNAKGWVNVMKQLKESSNEEETVSITVLDSKISDFEDDAFEKMNEEMRSESEGEGNTENLINIKMNQKPNIWVNIESCRSKLYWVPWRKSCSDVEDCEDAQRVVPASDVVNFICPIPSGVNYITDFTRQAAQFRHILNFLMTLREDFIPHTQTVDLVCSPFLSVALTESSSLFSEIYYWKRLSDLYTGKSSSENASKEYHVFAPEGFKFADGTSPNLATAAVLKPSMFELTLKGQDVDEKKAILLKENDEKFMEMFHRVLESGLELLDPEFSCLLFEMYLRFEQKLTCSLGGDASVKKRIKFAKGLMKHEKIRNSIGGYRELAMLEYFGGGSEQKAIDLLVKSINVTGKSLNLQDLDWDQVDWERDWKSVVDLVSLYRQLVELYLCQADSVNNAKAYYTLVQMANGFQTLEPDTLELEQGQEWKPKTNALLKATRSLEKIMSMIIPNFSLKSKSDSSVEETKEEEGEEKANSEIYFKWNGDKCIEFLLQQKNFINEWTICYALFQFLGKDYDAACQVYEGVFQKLGNEPLSRSDSYNPELMRVHIREQLYISWCNLTARCLVKDPLMNAKFRSILGRALEEFPSSPPLLLLFIDVENQTSVAGKLWRLMMANLKQDSEKVITHWAPLIMGIGLARKIEELEHDEEVGLPCFGLGGPAVPQDTIFYKLDSMISVAEQHPGARHCPLLWRVHLKMLALRAQDGKDVQRARAMFYDAIRHCPSSKALYIDGVTYFPDLLQEVNDLLAEKQLLIRLPIEELDVLLEMDEEIMDQGKKPKDDVEENDNAGQVMDDDIVILETIDGEKSPAKVGKGKNKRSRESRSEGELGDSD